MTKVFIGGSRKLIKLSPVVQDRLDTIIAKKFTVLVGDANGADKCVQSYLASKDYESVIVFCMEGRYRNNLGHWRTSDIIASSSEKSFSYYATKDLAMAKEATYGFMLWDAKSAGTLNNVINLLKESKKVLVYLSPEKSFHTLGNFHDLAELLAKCDKSMLKRFEDKLGIGQYFKEEQSKLEFA